jgi:hypothetical protein
MAEEEESPLEMGFPFLQKQTNPREQPQNLEPYKNRNVPDPSNSRVRKTKILAGATDQVLTTPLVQSLGLADKCHTQAFWLCDFFCGTGI